jgi:hypothetical protein
MDLLLLLLDGMVARGRGITDAGCLLPSSWEIPGHFTTTADMLLGWVALILAMVLAHSAAEELGV